MTKVARPRSFRVSDDLWTAAVAKAAAEGDTVTAVLVAALSSYVGSATAHRQARTAMIAAVSDGQPGLTVNAELP